MEDTMNLTCNNSNDTNFTVEECYSTRGVGATIISPLIMFILGVVGNVVAICIILISKKTARTSKFYILISGLAWTDLLGIVLTTPSVILAYINGRKWMGGEAHCFYQGFAMTCAGLSTTLIICAISVERFLALKCVFFYSSRCSHSSTRCLIVGLWTGVIWFGLLPVFGIGKYELQYPGTWCFLDFHSQDVVSIVYAYIYASLNLILILIMILCNGYVVYTLYSLRRRKELQLQGDKRDSLLNSQQTDWSTSGFKNARKKHNTVDTQMIVLMCAITTTFVICWAPLMIQIIVTMATKRSNYLWDLTAIRLASLNQLLDPWLYILLRKSVFQKVRRNMGKLWERCCCFCKVNDVDESGELVNILAVEMNREINSVYDADRPNNNVDCSIDENIPDVSNVSPIRRNIASPLPDVTQTGGKHMTDVNSENFNNNSSYSTSDTRQQYVCRFEIGQDEQNTDIGSVYIKVLFLANDWCDKDRNDRERLTSGLSCPRIISNDPIDCGEIKHVSGGLSLCQVRPISPILWTASNAEHRHDCQDSKSISLRRTKSTI